MATASYCCTCAAPLPPATVAFAPAARQHRQLPCCDRFVCSPCLHKNARFATYCPYCQIATSPPPRPGRADHEAGGGQNGCANEKDAARDVLPPGLKPPPPYRRAAAPLYGDRDEPPPPYEYSTAPDTKKEQEKEKEKGAPVLHYLDHDRDSITSLSLRYGVPADRLRRANHLTADHLLQARRVIQIPVPAPSAPSSSAPMPMSLSPQPVEDEAEVRRKAAIRRFMVACKVPDYDLAVLYLEQTACGGSGGGGDGSSGDDREYDLRAATAAYQADEQWERAHPAETAVRKRDKHKTHKTITGGGFFSRRHPAE